MTEQMYYKLQIYMDPGIVDSETQKLYEEKITKTQKIVDKYLDLVNNWDVSMAKDILPHIDAGFDLFTPNNNILSPGIMGQKVNMGIKCSMTFNNIPVGYQLYLRSSTGAKTPLRLSNSVGIIDSGYRGYIIALLDNITPRDNDNNSDDWDYVIYKDDRIVQICSPNITYPIYPELVDSVEALTITSRGDGAFGSTGT
jgi:dUTP pyrophosphatase